MKISPSKEVLGKDGIFKYSSRNMEGIITILKNNILVCKNFYLLFYKTISGYVFPMKKLSIKFISRYVERFFSYYIYTELEAMYMSARKIGKRNKATSYTGITCGCRINEVNI